MSGYAVFSRFSLNYGASKLVEIIFLSPTSLDVSMRQPRIFIYSRSGSAGLWFPWGAGERLLKNTNTTANQSKVFPFPVLYCTGLYAFSHIFIQDIFLVGHSETAYLFSTRDQRPNSWTKYRQKSEEFSSILFTVPLQLCLEISISSNSLNLLHIPSTHATSYVFLQISWCAL
jgi:hypothetical protein